MEHHNGNESEADMDDSIIILADGKYGEPSKWQFPEAIDTCPVLTCKKKYENRLALISHYRRVHAKYFTMCNICDIPVVLKYLNDHEKTSRHRIARSTKKVEEYRNNEMNKQADGTANRSQPNNPRADEHINKDRNGYDDVTSGDGVPKMNDMFRFKIFGSHLFKDWQFPQITQCPVSNCYQEFESRSSTIEHYRVCHAKYIVWCNDCNRGISVKSHDRFYKHCTSHPDLEIPSNWRKYLPEFKCNECHEIFSTLREQVEHTNEGHNDEDVKNDHQHKANGKSEQTPFQMNGNLNVNASEHEPKEMRTFKMPVFDMPMNIKPEPKDSSYDAFERMGESSNDPRPTIKDPLYAHKSYLEAIQEFECTKCNYIFDDENSLHQHFAKKHNMKALQMCVICKQYLRCHSARQHYFLKHSCFVNQCPFCLVCFMDLDSFQGHILEKHSGEIMTHLKSNVKMERMSDNEQTNGTSDDDFDKRYGNEQYWRKRGMKRKSPSGMRPDNDHWPWKYPKKNMSNYSGLAKNVKREIPSPRPYRGYETMESRYHSKYEPNGMPSYGNIKSEMLSDNENDEENMRFEKSSIDLSHCGSY